MTLMLDVKADKRFCEIQKKLKLLIENSRGQITKGDISHTLRSTM